MLEGKYLRILAKFRVLRLPKEHRADLSDGRIQDWAIGRQPSHLDLQNPLHQEPSVRHNYK